MFRRLRKRRWWKYEPAVELPLLAGFLAILGFLGYSFVARVCSWRKPGRYCDRHELWAWLVDEGGWWKVAMTVVVIGLLAFFSWKADSNQPQADDNTLSPDRKPNDP